MDEFWRELSADWPGAGHLLTLALRLVLAAFVGALPGLQRELTGVAAGLRTHMLVSLGSAIFVLAAVEAGATIADTTRVIQGLAAGIGFVGAGAILKSVQTSEVHGLTTAAGVWMTAALGSAVGLGQVWLPVFGSVLALFILSALKQLEPGASHRKHDPPAQSDLEPGNKNIRG